MTTHCSSCRRPAATDADWARLNETNAAGACSDLNCRWGAGVCWDPGGCGFPPSVRAGHGRAIPTSRPHPEVTR